LVALNYCSAFKLIFNVISLYKQVWKRLENKADLSSKIMGTTVKFMYEPSFYFGVSHASYPKRAECQRSQFFGSPIFLHTPLKAERL